MRVEKGELWGHQYCVARDKRWTLVTCTQHPGVVGTPRAMVQGSQKRELWGLGHPHSAPLTEVHLEKNGSFSWRNHDCRLAGNFEPVVGTWLSLKSGTLQGASRPNRGCIQRQWSLRQRLDYKAVLSLEVRLSHFGTCKPPTFGANLGREISRGKMRCPTSKTWRGRVNHWKNKRNETNFMRLMVVKWWWLFFCSEHIIL